MTPTRIQFYCTSELRISNWIGKCKYPAISCLAYFSTRDSEVKNHIVYIKMNHILKILGLLAAISAVWIGLLQASIVPSSYAWLLPVYLIISLGCYGLFMVGVGLLFFPTCPQESHLLQKDIAEAKYFLKSKGIDLNSD